MRASGALLIAALLAAGYALYLNSRDATASLDAVTTMADGLREEHVDGRSFDAQAAASMITAMEELAAAPDTIGDHVEDLRVFADTAASWAAAAPSASVDLHVAVSLRTAASELRAHALDRSAAHLMRARQKLESARGSLAGEDSSDRKPVRATDGLRDRLENLQLSAEEQRQSVDEALKR